MKHLWSIIKLCVIKGGVPVLNFISISTINFKQAS